MKPFKRKMKGDFIQWEKEYPKIKKMIKEKYSLTNIGKEYGVSRQRIFQIVQRIGYTPKKTYKDLT